MEIVFFFLVFPCSFLCWFSWQKATRDVCVGERLFWCVSGEFFRLCFFDVFFGTRSVFFGWVLHDTRLSMVEIGGFSGRLLQREVPSEDTCLQAPTSVTVFSRRMFRLVFVWVFIYFSVHSLPL